MQKLFTKGLKSISVLWLLHEVYFPSPSTFTFKSLFSSVQCKLQSVLEFDSPSLLALQFCKPLNHVSGIVLHIFGFPPFPAKCDHGIADISGILGKMRDSLFNSDAV